MNFCNEHGMAHSTFLSWQPEDRAKALAFVLESAERCSLCGTAEWEWAEDRFAYEPREKFCKGCYYRNSEQDNIKGSLPGTTVELVKMTPVLRAQQELSERARRSMSLE